MDFSPFALSIYLIISFNSAVVAGLVKARCLIASNSPQILKKRSMKSSEKKQTLQFTFDILVDNH